VLHYFHQVYEPGKRIRLLRHIRWSEFRIIMTSIDKEESYKVEPLHGSANYRTWKFSMRMVLQAKDLWEIVSGEEEKSESESSIWEKRARKALAIIS
jgi:hypothetical protein